MMAMIAADRHLDGLDHLDAHRPTAPSTITSTPTAPSMLTGIGLDRHPLGAFL